MEYTNKTLDLNKYGFPTEIPTYGFGFVLSYITFLKNKY